MQPTAVRHYNTNTDVSVFVDIWGFLSVISQKEQMKTTFKDSGVSMATRTAEYTGGAKTPFPFRGPVGHRSHHNMFVVS